MSAIQGRGACRVCGRNVRLRTDGNVRDHGGPRSCDGTGSPPAAVTVVQVYSMATHPRYRLCWPCHYGGHYDPPRRHVWVDPEDAAAVVAAGQPRPQMYRCACFCAETKV